MSICTGNTSVRAFNAASLPTFIFPTNALSNTKKLEKEKQLQEAMLGIKKKFGKNAVLRGTNYLDGATMRERNEQIGGHKAK